MNPFKPRISPDFEADGQLPEWIPMGESETPDISPLVGAMKKRMTKPQTDLPYSQTLNLSTPKDSGGMKSL